MVHKAVRQELKSLKQLMKEEFRRNKTLRNAFKRLKKTKRK